MPFRDAALLLLGHGSTLNADSSAPTYQHAEELRRRGIFAEVHVGFWKEEPNFRQALRQTDCARVYVVPNFISSGYFTEQVIPRELGLTGAITRQGHQEVIACVPVGLHPTMTPALLQRASEVVLQSGEALPDPARTACLFICGHGTSFNDNSTKIIHEQAQVIRAMGLYADCQPVLMEQRPFVKDWRTLTSCPDVIVVPFFISDGLHSFEDIPVLLGITPNVTEQDYLNPHREVERRLWYANAIGTEKSIADVILAQVQQAERQSRAPTVHGEKLPPPIRSALEEWMKDRPAPWQIGQVMIHEGFTLRHGADADLESSALARLTEMDALREWIRLDGAGQFRPLRAAPNLRRGWIYFASDLAALHAALDLIYPAELANWLLSCEEKLPITPWRQTAERQSGRFRVVREIDAHGVADLVSRYCEPGCLKQRLWSPANEKVQADVSELPLLCPEACNFLVGKAREKIKGPEID